MLPLGGADGAGEASAGGMIAKENRQLGLKLLMTGREKKERVKYFR